MGVAGREEGRVGVNLQEAAAARRAALSGGQHREAAAVPAGVRNREAPPQAQQVRAAADTIDGKEFLTLDGYASTYERGYEMWDWYGPYTEVVSAGAGEKSLSANPDVVFLINHRGLPLARTRAGTLDLSEDEVGLRSVSRMNAKRAEAIDLHEAISDGTVTEMSFAFMIELGTWSPDYLEYRIQQYEIDRGDTSAVTFGANPTTSIEARAQFARTVEVMRALESLEGPALAAAHERLAKRLGATLTTKPGPAAVDSLRLLRAAVEQGPLGERERAQVASLLRRAEDGTLADLLAAGPSVPTLAAAAAQGPAAAAATGGMSLELAEALLATS